MDWVKKHPIPVAGLSITLLFLLFVLVRIDFLDTFELKVYDVMMRLRSAPEADSPIVLVDIDDDSIEKLGRWPWPRSLLARGIEKINTGQPRVIGLNIILSEAYQRIGTSAPWPFWKDRCYRTMKNMHPGVQMERAGTHHNALDDAKTQALHLMRINDEFGGFL